MRKIKTIYQNRPLRFIIALNLMLPNKDENKVHKMQEREGQ